jgi:hypothetical protein
MPDVETFDAFYARTVWNVTSQMHQLADGDGAADHAIREAYARAYQQWYEISAFPDTEGWVLGAAKDAYQRRRPDAAVIPRQPGPVTPPGAPAGAAGADRSGQDDERSDSTWPGIYRPRAVSAAAPPGSAGSPSESGHRPPSERQRPRQPARRPPGSRPRLARRAARQRSARLPRASPHRRASRQAPGPSAGPVLPAAGRLSPGIPTAAR